VTEKSTTHSSEEQPYPPTEPHESWVWLKLEEDGTETAAHLVGRTQELALRALEDDERLETGQVLRLAHLRECDPPVCDDCRPERWDGGLGWVDA
jgi:hypothetical protein